MLLFSTVEKSGLREIVLDGAVTNADEPCAAERAIMARSVCLLFIIVGRCCNLIDSKK